MLNRFRSSPLLLPLLVLTVMVAPAGLGEPLSDLRVVLQRYPARTAFLASASLRVNSEAADIAGARGGSTSFEVESGVAGITLRIAPAALAAAEGEAERKKRNPDSPTPTRTAMVALTVFDVVDALDLASMLLNELEGSTLIKQSPATHAGRTVTLLRIKVKPTLAGTGSRYVKEPKIELRVWVGPDGLPLVVERDSNYSAAFLFLKAANDREEHWEVAVSGDRLYASRADQSNRASAVGKKIESSHSVTYVPK